MLQVNNSSRLSAKSLTSPLRPGGFVQATDPAAAGESDTYARIDAAGFHAQKTNSNGAQPAGRMGTGEQPQGRTAFKDLLDANAAASAAVEATTQQDTSRFLASRQWGPAAGGGNGATAPSSQPKWSVSLDGGRIHLALNPAAR
jgi:hypothetical protein